MELNIITILYLFFRLAPFIIVSYFSIASVFNQDIKGVIYLVGVIASCFFTIIVGNTVGDGVTTVSMETTGAVPNNVCNMVTIGDKTSFSKMPIGLSILSYTFSYLTYVIAKYDLQMYNLPTLIIFPILILGDAMWNIKNNCFTSSGVFLSIAVGLLVGAIWAYIIASIKQPRLQYFNVGDNKTVCQRPSKQLFKCTFKS